MQFMVIERFRSAQAVAEVYRRFAEQGRMLPEGLSYVSSWIEPSFARCFQVMECEDARLLQAWVLRWHDLVDFEIVPVLTSQETAEVVRAAGRA